MFRLSKSATALALFLSAYTFAQTPATSAGEQTPDSTEIEVAHAVKASYPLEAHAQNLQGQVVVKVLISETGDVEKAEVISGDPVFVKPALEAAKQWKFKPFIQNGKTIKIATRIPFDFAFSEAVKDVAPKITTDADGTKRVTVPSGVVTGLLIHRVTPEYPPIAESHHIVGTVVLHAIIGKDGKIKDLKVVSGPEMLARSALGAVQQWAYKPYLLKGEPIEVDTQIVVHFGHTVD